VSGHRRGKDHENAVVLAAGVARFCNLLGEVLFTKFVLIQNLFCFISEKFPNKNGSFRVSRLGTIANSVKILILCLTETVGPMGQML
jgi:hypothetical protein